jgi:anti-anti-sigma regulatory factor
LHTCAVMVRDVAVVSLIGGLGAHSVPLCRAAVDEALDRHPVGLVLDLRRVVHDTESIAVLGMLRRYAARHRTPLWLAGTPPRLAAELRRAGVLEHYYLAPTVSGAIRAAALVSPDDGLRHRGVLG